jgi:hypothetical protein
VTTTFTSPWVPLAPVVHVIDVAETKVTGLQAIVPSATVMPSVKSVPVIVTSVPPAVEPTAGEIAVTVGTSTRAIREILRVVAFRVTQVVPSVRERIIPS